MSSNGGGDDESDDGRASSASSYTSGDFGVVARSGFTRMYVLSHSALCPVDTSDDYRSEFVAEDRTASSSSSEPPCYQLLYASGGHYFHGAIELPASLGLESSGDGGDDGTRRAHLPHNITIADLPVLLPHFQRQQDALLAVDKVTDFRSEVRDVVYQMEEVGAFMVEELSTDKTIARIEHAARELDWVVSDANPTFFELETRSSANDDLDSAGVVLIVMKTVVRGVLLDVIYSRSSYFVVLRDNSEELALEDTFVPNVGRAGPCFVVRRYKDDDIKRLMLWCALPTQEMKSEGVAPVTLHFHPELSSAACKPNARVTPMAARCERAILQANDTQLYCLLPARSGDKQAAKPRKKQRRRSDRKARGNDSEEDDDDEREHRSHVIFQFNQYVYSGELWLRPALLDDVAKLTTHVLPHLRAQSHLLEFYGETDDLPSSEHGGGDSTPADPMMQFVSVRHRLNEVAPTLLTLLAESQAWIEAFLAEVDAIVATEECTSSSSSSEWLASHLKAWLEADDGAEAFFELELGPGSPFTHSTSTSGDLVDLVVWKGIVHAAVMLVVYRSGSFYMMLREQPSECASIATQDDRELFGAIPPLGSKGRGYLVRKFPDASQPQWLAGAKLLLWQTSASLAQEEIREARARDERRKSGRSNESPCADWFVDESAAEAKAGGSLVSGAQLADAKSGKDTGAKDACAAPAKATAPSADKVSRRHHIPPLSTPTPQVGSGAAAPPWDLRTGRPL